MNKGDTEDDSGDDKHSHKVTGLWDQDHSRVIKLGPDIDKLDEDYLRDTGMIIYTTKKHGAGNSVINVMRTTIQRPSSGAAR